MVATEGGGPAQAETPGDEVSISAPTEGADGHAAQDEAAQGLFTSCDLYEREDTELTKLGVRTWFLSRPDEGHGMPWVCSRPLVHGCGAGAVR